ncbi:hypothetical protein [Spirosoma endophyticum]|uniref:Uncharacterized protein n=1 Tax=Spirosoma endophyticum TaxID=662367 RepID=A0A1I2DG94_9BACT|nr:hypothetical protein [Spirosoma endophyticum]SFE79556.1 hypothetical protein SAMN05216167_119121 [Spirosoma endophyticum]
MSTLDLTAPLYKYTKSHHADRMMAEGWIRVGTLYEYRDIERHGPEIGDDMEGKRQLRFQGDGVIKHFRAGGLTITNARVINSGGRTLNIFAQNSPDSFMFCCTHELDEVSMRKMGYDACVCISNPTLFFAEVTASMTRMGLTTVSEALINKVVYVSKNDVLSGTDARKDHGTLPSIEFQKDERFDHQKEVRAIWNTRLKDFKPELVKVQRIKESCERII